MRTSKLLLFTGLSALVALAAACGDDDEPPPPTTGPTSTSSGTGGNGGDPGTGGTGGTGGDTTSTGGTGGTGVGGTGGTGGSEQMIHGCTPSTAEDLSGMNTVTITNGNPWEAGHNRCIRVAQGATVIWEGDFGSHPLSGGIEGTPDNPANNPIEAAVPVNTTATVVFASTGTFPYFCDNHPTTMTGVVYVE